MTRTASPVLQRDRGDLSVFYLLIARGHHFIGLGQVGPQLKAIHAPIRVAGGHLLVENAAPGGHPLHIPGENGAAVAHAVGVLDLSAQHVGDRLDAPVRMPGEPGQVIGGFVVAEIVQQQERVEDGGLAGTAKAAVQMDARALEGGLAIGNLLDLASSSHTVLLILRNRQTSLILTSNRPPARACSTPPGLALTGPAPPPTDRGWPEGGAGARWLRRRSSRSRPVRCRWHSAGHYWHPPPAAGAAARSKSARVRSVTTAPRKAP